MGGEERRRNNGESNEATDQFSFQNSTVQTVPPKTSELSDTKTEDGWGQFCWQACWTDQSTCNKVICLINVAICALDIYLIANGAREHVIPTLEMWDDHPVITNQPTHAKKE